MLQKIKNLYHGVQALLGQTRYGFPSYKLDLIGVTGTDGKTTTSHLIYSVLQASGRKSALVSTISARIGSDTIDTGLHVTTPDPWEVPALIHKAVEKGCDSLVMEVSSHGLDQNRVLGCRFILGVYTTISHEHLDYHKTLDHYIQAKVKLLAMAETAIVNVDDAAWPTVRALLPKGKRLITYSMTKADVTPKKFPFTTALPGKYNQYNCLAAICVGKALGLPEAGIRKGIHSVKGISGRFEEIPNTKGFRIIVDFAHKPNAFKELFKAVHEKYPTGRKIVVFGAAGERDYLKRPMMGEIAAQYNNVVIITAEDPRSERVEDITETIAQGSLKAGAREVAKDNVKGEHVDRSIFRISDRQEAIKFALREVARKGDVILFLGKGHEKSMCYGTIEYPWNEHSAIRNALGN